MRIFRNGAVMVELCAFDHQNAAVVRFALSFATLRSSAGMFSSPCAKQHGEGAHLAASRQTGSCSTSQQRLLQVTSPNHTRDVATSAGDNGKAWRCARDFLKCSGTAVFGAVDRDISNSVGVFT